MSNYSGNATASQSPSPAPSVGGVPIADLPDDGDPLTAASIAQALKVPADWAAFFASLVKGRHNPLYGTGSDGDVTIGVATNAAREMHYNNLTVNFGAFLNTRGHIIRVKETLTFQSGAIGLLDIGASSTANVGGATVLPRAYTWAGKEGPDGALAGINGSASGGPQAPLFCFGGAGGAGGASPVPKTGGAGAVCTQGHLGFGVVTFTGNIHYNVTSPLGVCLQDGGVDITGSGFVTTNGGVTNRQRLIGGLTGGSGGGGSVDPGGGAGEGGGIVIALARRIVVNGSTTGYQGSSSAYSPFCAQGGHGGITAASEGGGGGGGVVLVVSGDWSGPALTSACVLGGLPGSGGGGSGVQGSPGNWAVLQIQ